MTTIYKQISPTEIQTLETLADGRVRSSALLKVEGVWQDLAGEPADLSGITLPSFDEEAYLTAQATEQAVSTFKASRQNLLDNATVTANGFQFDADEISIGRMASAVLAAYDELDTFVMQWSLADTATGVMTNITLADLKLAHKLAVQNMANIWGVS